MPVYRIKMSQTAIGLFKIKAALFRRKIFIRA